MLKKDEENEISFIAGVGRSGGVNASGGLGVGGTNTAAGGSEHSNDTETTEQKDLNALYDEFRLVFTENRISEKDQHFIFKAFEDKSESDIKLFVQ